MRWGKRFIAVAMSALMLGMSGAYLNVMADTSQIIQPFWINASSVYAGLNFSDSTANCFATVNGLSGTTSISATIKLERKVGTTYVAVKTWTQTGKSMMDFSDKYDVTKGYTYRLTVTADVTRNGVTETVSNSSEKSL